MSDLVNPRTQPELAAFQLVAELIRAERTHMVTDNVDNLLKVYDQALQRFKALEEADNDEPPY